MALTIKLRQGTKSQLGVLNSGLTIGEPLYVTDTEELFVADSATTHKTVKIDLESLTAIDGATVHGDDLLYIYDVSQTAGTVKARKVTVTNLKIAMNIPDGDTDEKVATASGNAADYLGTDGTDGVLRTGNGIKMTSGTNVTTLTFNLPSEVQGDIVYRGATEWARLAAGSAGDLLRSGGAAANPSWINTIDGGTFA